MCIDSNITERERQVCSPTEDSVLKIPEEDRAINEEIDRLVEIKRQIREVINQVDDVTCRLLLEKRLVARTWGNFSARLDETHFVITPSGLGYEQMIADDMVRFCLADETWEGTRKPSSEKGFLFSSISRILIREKLSRKQ